MPPTFAVRPDDPWYIEPSETLAILEAVQDHCKLSISCTHGRDFTYDFCPIANGNLQLAIDHLRSDK